jgi:hypothetical protein
MPRIMPAIIDSHGNPGIAGNVIGVETELVLEVASDVDVDVVVGVLTTVVVTREVLTTVVVNELAVVTGVEDVELLDVVEIELEVVTVVVDGGAVVVTVPPPVPPVGGSR